MADIGFFFGALAAQAVLVVLSHVFLSRWESAGSVKFLAIHALALTAALAVSSFGGAGGALHYVAAALIVLALDLIRFRRVRL